MPVGLGRKALSVSLFFLVTACASAGEERAAAPAATSEPAQSSACVAIMQFSRASFSAADQNRDGVIDEAEFASDVAAAFAGEDRNRDYRLVRADFPDAPSGSFERLDADNKGFISFKDLMRAKLDQLQRADANGDGVLTLVEVTRFNASQGGC